MTDEKTESIPAAINPTESGGLVDKAVAAAERIEAANKKMEELIARNENLIAKQMLAGRAEAGAEIKPRTEADIAEDYANKLTNVLRK